MFISLILTAVLPKDDATRLYPHKHSGTLGFLTLVIILSLHKSHLFQGVVHLTHLLGLQDARITEGGPLKHDPK